MILMKLIAEATDAEAAAEADDRHFKLELILLRMLKLLKLLMLLKPRNLSIILMPLEL